MDQTKVGAQKGTKEYHGTVVPMITPVTDEGELDEAAARRVIDHMIAGGVDGIFVLGTTGESMSTPYALRNRLVAVLVEHTAGRAQTYAGVSSNIMSHSIEAAELYASLGVDALVAHPPFYYPLTPDELLHYFSALADNMPAPLLLYNMPATTGMSIPLDVVEKLSHHPMVRGLKDSERDPQRQRTGVEIAAGRDDFVFFTGVASYATQALRWGANGHVPSSGNLVPELCSTIYASACAGDWERAEEAQQKADAVGAAYQEGRTLGQSLAGLKYAMHLRGLCEPAVLPPLMSISAAERQRVDTALLSLGFYQPEAGLA